MEKEVLIKVEGLSKKFCKDLRTSLWYGLKDLYANVLGNKKERSLRAKEFWALKDINFELRRGECLGLIGHNGAGKSTLLKILNGLINPDEGKVTIKGRVGALIELGAGFNPILTGRENIYNNGAVLGFTREEINTKVEHIIAFSELEEFIDMPVQNYSSGMKVRLGFGVAAQMEPDVLLIDEVLAVGDLGFTIKCFKTIDTILPKTAIVFVSHSMPLISRICNQIILMENGNSNFQGLEVAKGIDLYYTRFANNQSNVVYSDGSIELLKVSILNEVGFNNDIPLINWGDDLNLHFKFKLTNKIDPPIFIIEIFDKEQRSVACLTNNDVNLSLENDNNFIEFVVSHNNIELSKGVYTIDVIVKRSEKRDPYLRVKNILSFQVLHDIDIFAPFLLSSNFKKK